MGQEIKDTRREMLKKAGKTAVFVIPTIATFHISALTVMASTVIEASTKSGNNGNHYGNDMGDQNGRDQRNRHNTHP